MDLGKALEGQALPDGLAEPLHGGGSSCLKIRVATKNAGEAGGELWSRVALVQELYKISNLAVCVSCAQRKNGSRQTWLSAGLGGV